MFVCLSAIHTLEQPEGTYLIDQSLDGNCGHIPGLVSQPVCPVSESTRNASDIVKVFHRYSNTFERSRVGEVLGVQSGRHRN